ncbi:MAG: hypothetical protein JWL64_2827 [Frankiales bacterium]|nr:hypothetical protein [Frankiales bacterium]
MTRIRTTVLLGAVAVATLGLYVTSLVLTTQDQAATFDTDPVTTAAKAACTSLRSDLQAMPLLPPGSSLEVRQARVRDQSARMRLLVTQVQAVGDRALDDDRPSRQWLRDWDTLAGAREAYAAGGLVGAFTVPLVDGQPLTRRMSDIGLRPCIVPPELTTAP